MYVRNKLLLFSIYPLINLLYLGAPTSLTYESGVSVVYRFLYFIELLYMYLYVILDYIINCTMLFLNEFYKLST